MAAPHAAGAFRTCVERAGEDLKPAGFTRAPAPPK
jgi:hypothetical protein